MPGQAGLHNKIGNGWRMLVIPGVEIISELGRGARGVVYRGRAQGRDVAVKVPLLGDPSQLFNFRREGSLLACVSHPGLAEVYEVGEAASKGYIITEYLDGATLLDELKQGSMPPSRVEQLGLILAGARSAIHSQSLIHRDIKPSNIIWTSTGPKLIDFGLASREESG